jgi:hypothetical protein
MWSHGANRPVRWGKPIEYFALTFLADCGTIFLVGRSPLAREIPTYLTRVNGMHGKEARKGRVGYACPYLFFPVSQRCPGGADPKKGGAILTYKSTGTFNRTTLVRSRGLIEIRT